MNLSSILEAGVFHVHFSTLYDCVTWIIRDLPVTGLVVVRKFQRGIHDVIKVIDSLTLDQRCAFRSL